MTEGESLPAESDPHAGLYIIISGLVKVSGVITDNSNYAAMLADSRFLQKLGGRRLATQPSRAALRCPQVESFRSAAGIPINHTDYRSTGQTVGELAFLTGTECDMRAVCDTSVQLYHVLYDTLQVGVYVRVCLCLFVCVCVCVCVCVIGTVERLIVRCPFREEHLAVCIWAKISRPILSPPPRGGLLVAYLSNC